ncbi:tRNA dimethylallyltransferase [Alkalithermobacter thermoalcaliphilus JW-YL-7 = DSM 7308]|uniref:tRNA dimethylallyltransferase n=1 Tax=Alkalithermobacter thermoalcaliphilus JW-YL-7 = DSM 7308 TaxID=1121328 RepID=A0A150FRK7_CLOPD|nr:tRNA dimethylallyltransferase [[Clostridium] paradoxum JW-YL-7 = DSM 7308]SHK80506.1 tRNA dimethylallyltransferase [[Clostridium] paradoxum JW-YL-7 = DSM 7308]
MSIPLVIICGPTAVGKTDISIDIAKRLNTSIISADSMQIYKYMNIGTAKISYEEMKGIKHYLIDEVDPKTPFSVAEFQKLAKEYILKIYNQEKIPLIVGGTGLYINSIIYDMDFSKSDSDDSIRKQLEQEALEYGPEFIHNKLKDIDSSVAERIHPNNVKRVIRALEIYIKTGEQIGNFKKDIKLNSEYHPIIIILNRHRQNLYDRINKRVDLMIENGLIDEVKNLLSLGYHENMTSMQGIGYKEIIKYLKGEYSLEEAIYIIKRDSRRYAKRQLTWFKRYSNAKWFNIDDFSNRNDLIYNILQYVEGNLKLMKK